MKILIDMNLSPQWVEVLGKAGHEVRHWKDVGKETAPDNEIMAWALSHGFIVFTHDLDFSHILAATHAEGPSVIQIRGEDVLPASIATQVKGVLVQFEKQLSEGALISLDPYNARIRILPF